MKLLQVIPTYVPAVRHGGPVRAVHQLARELVERGHELSVFTTDLDGRGRLDLPTDRDLRLNGVRVRYFRATSPRRAARAPEMATALAAEAASFDLVHVHSLFLWPVTAATRAAERAGAPWLISPRGMLVKALFARRGDLRKRLWLRWAGRRAITRARRLVVTSELERLEAERFSMRLPPIAVLPNGVELPARPADPEELPAAAAELVLAGPMFLYLGRLSWKKGLDRLLHALDLTPGATLVLAGPDDEGIFPALERLARELGVVDRLRWIGFVDGAPKRALLAAARALVLPSLSENFGNVVLEAWAEGTAVVVTPEVGLAADVRACGGGRVADGEPPAFAAALRELGAGDAGAARRMGERGRERARAEYAWGAVAARAEALYDEVVAESRRR